MPFPPHATLGFPPLPADVEIHFKGLLLLMPVQAGAKTYCEVGLLQALQHNLKIEVTDVDLGTPVPTPTGRPIKSPLFIHSTDSGVFKYVSTATPFPGDHNSNQRDFRWAVDLKALHPNSSPKDPARLYRAVTLKDGLLFTSVLTNLIDHAVHLVHPSSGPKCWNRIAAEIGARIELAAGQRLTLNWNDGGAQTLQLPLASGIGHRYVVRITNLPPMGSAIHDDFQHYYDLAIDSPDPWRYGLNLYRRIGGERGAGVDAPCMSGSQDGDGRTY